MYAIHFTLKKYVIVVEFSGVTESFWIKVQKKTKCPFVYYEFMQLEAVDKDSIDTIIENVTKELS